MPANEFPKQSAEPSVHTSEQLRAWLVSAVAEAAGLDPLAVDPDRPIAELGLGSRQLVTMAADLAARTGRTVEPSLVFNHPTITELADAILGERPQAEDAVAPGDAPGRARGG